MNNHAASSDRRREIGERVRTEAAAHVAEYGWSMTGVFPREDDAANVKTYCCYTAGLWLTWRHPEFVVFGLKPEVAHAIVSDLVVRIKAGEAFYDGQLLDNLVRDYRAAFRRAPNDDRDWPTSAATLLYGHQDYPVLQIVLPDTSDRLPWEDGCDATTVLMQDGVWLH